MINPKPEVVKSLATVSRSYPEIVRWLKEWRDHELKTLFHEANLAQVEINKLEAKGNWFQSSWRPLTGYVCVAGLAINFLISPIAKGFGIDVPQADAGVMMPLLTGMLGIAGMRSYDKLKKTDSK